MIFGGVAAAIVAAGLTVLLVMIIGGDGSPFSDRAASAPDLRPPLARACPAPTVSPGIGPSAAPSAPAPATGERTVDETAGISYRRYGAPWTTWTEVWNAVSSASERTSPTNTTPPPATRSTAPASTLCR